MAATVQIHEMTAAAAGVDKTSGTIRFKAADDQTVDTNNRLQIPAPTATIYSYTKHARFYLQSAPSVDIQNLRCYTDGANGFDGASGYVGVQYNVPAAGLGTFPNINTNIAGTDLFTKTSGSPVDLDAINTGPHTGTGYKGDHIRMQMSVTDQASPGTLTAEPMTFAYDET
jgi:hypothetical protein